MTEHSQSASSLTPPVYIYWLWLLYRTAVLCVASSALKEIHWIVILISDQIVEMLNTASISMATVKPNAAYTLFHVRNVA